MLSSQEDPAGVLDRAALFMEVLNGALSAEREAMLEVAVRVQDDLNEAASVLLNLTPQIEAILTTPNLPENAVKDFVVQTYGRLTEGCFRRVANLFLYAMFAEKGSMKDWEDVSDWASFGEKHQWLANAGDEPAFQSALEGVESIVRNSDAHSEVHFVEGGVRFVQTDFRARTKEEKIFSDDELGGLLRDLVRTVLSLSMAAQLFQADNINAIASDLFSVETPRELRGLYLELFLAVTGLQEPEVSGEGPDLTVSAAVPSLQPPATLYDYVKTLFFVREFYPDFQTFSLDVTWLGEWHCSVRAPAERLDALKDVPEHLALPRALALLFSSNTSSASLPERSDEAKIREIGFGIGCGALYEYLAQSMRVIESGWSSATPRLQEALQYLDEFKEAVAIPVGLSNKTKAQRDELVQTLGDVGHLYRTLVRVDRGVLDTQAIGRAEKRYNRGADTIKRFAKSYTTSERLF